MKKFLGILAATIVSILLFQDCQKSDFLVVTGVVRDSVTNMPVKGVLIEADGKLLFSANDGTFTLNGIQPGKHSIWVSDRSRQYYSESKSVIISSGSVNKVDFSLNPVPIPEVETGTVSNISGVTATASGSIKLQSDIVYRYGHVWSFSNNTPTIENCISFTSFGPGSGTFDFVSNITSLHAETVYYVRAYAITSAGVTIYGNTVAFNTSVNNVNQGLIFYYPFDGNTFDLSGNAFSLSDEEGMPTYTTDRFGVNNNACHFDMGKWYGGNPPALNDFAVSLWFRKNNLWEPTQEHLIQIGDNYGGSGQDRFYIKQDVDPRRFSAGIMIGGTNGTNYRASLGFYPSLNTWHHVVAQRSGTSFKLYIDGDLKSTVNCPSDELATADYFNIGGAWSTPGPYTYEQFHGDLDDIRLYNRALTDDEIQYLKNN